MTGNPNDLDTGKLESYLQGVIAGFGTIDGLKKFSGGQSNPTFMLKTSNGNYVLRRKPMGKLLPSAHAVDREFKVMSALAGTGVPVPTMHHLCADDDVIGSMFYVMEFLDGRTFFDQTLPEQTNEERTSIFDEMNRTLAAMHSVDVKAAGLEDYGKPGNYFERQLGRWTKQYRSAQTDDLPDVEQVIKWLGENMAEDDGQVSLVHGDYRLDNLMFAKDEPKAIALLDWELSTLGHPTADLAYQCAQWRLAPGVLTRGLAGIDRKAQGIPSEEEYVEKYCERRGITGVDNWAFALVFSLFRLTSIVQGVKKRALQGNASSGKALEMAKMIDPLARVSVEIIENEA